MIEVPIPLLNVIGKNIADIATSTSYPGILL